MKVLPASEASHSCLLIRPSPSLSRWLKSAWQGVSTAAPPAGRTVATALGLALAMAGLAVAAAVTPVAGATAQPARASATRQKGAREVNEVAIGHVLSKTHCTRNNYIENLYTVL